MPPGSRAKVRSRSRSRASSRSTATATAPKSSTKSKQCKTKKSPPRRTRTPSQPPPATPTSPLAPSIASTLTSLLSQKLLTFLLTLLVLRSLPSSLFPPSYFHLELLRSFSLFLLVDPLRRSWLRLPPSDRFKTLSVMLLPTLITPPLCLLFYIITSTITFPPPLSSYIIYTISTTLELSIEPLLTLSLSLSNLLIKSKADAVATLVKNVSLLVLFKTGKTGLIYLSLTQLFYSLSYTLTTILSSSNLPLPPNFYTLNTFRNLPSVLHENRTKGRNGRSLCGSESITVVIRLRHKRRSGLPRSRARAFAMTDIDAGQIVRTGNAAVSVSGVSAGLSPVRAATAEDRARLTDLKTSEVLRRHRLAA